VVAVAAEEKGEEEQKRPEGCFVSLSCDVEAYRFCWGLAVPSSSLGRKRREGQDKATGMGFFTGFLGVEEEEGADVCTYLNFYFYFLPLLRQIRPAVGNRERVRSP
jgi:hypothetical protein